MISDISLINLEKAWFRSDEFAYRYRMTIEFNISYAELYRAQSLPATYQDLFDHIHIEEILTDNLIGLA